MTKLHIHSHPEVKKVFRQYPVQVRKKMEKLRELVLVTASEIEGVNSIEETLKWGEPSYISKHGSTIRMDWKPKNPEQYALYFKCTSELVPSFKSIYTDQLTFEGNRAVIFGLEDELPIAALKKCIAAALRYHKVKHLPALGM